MHLWWSSCQAVGLEAGVGVLKLTALTRSGVNPHAPTKLSLQHAAHARDCSGRQAFARFAQF